MGKEPYNPLEIDKAKNKQLQDSLRRLYNIHVICGGDTDPRLEAFSAEGGQEENDDRKKDEFEKKKVALVKIITQTKGVC